MGLAKNPGESAKRVLVIKLSALGDFVLALGAMRAIRENHPKAVMTLLTTPPYEGLAKATGFFQHIETDGRPKGVKATRELLKRMKAARYDIIYDLQTSGRTANYFKALNLPFSTPPLWSGHAEGSAFFHDNPQRGNMHSIDRLADQLKTAGIGPDKVKGGWPPMPDMSFVRRSQGDKPSLTPAFFSVKEPFALFIPGASAHRSAKRWPAERFGGLAKHVADAGITPVIIGGKAESEIAVEINRIEPRARNIVTRTDLFQIVALAEKALFAVGNDTGPMHMAALSGCPGVALFATSESDPEKACPRGSNIIVAKADTLDELSVRDVWQAVLMLSVIPEAAAGGQS
ncbi:glycosyltransferase family 9 protein [Henriciella mobilis]|uniref:Lipopolysaccharide heptosyltransferase family protein n=1 Tax=Henriciella mobilis TaxID=2305467 RepID=A0A399RKY2_9PROT|nr:glycosyltransferase family 9 protein [Henriciella mobilis]RIJ17107.1 lipopolysaccharide heptosyltransferase family protein [Henriciella mobilis]RIJ22713.1 lipopolysaccharide heptosyltransferase family protein [Henriciella mobilis]RIJ32370.1 lipopolysaccharide heptosyltransferase family protein [Henriciella mobilis]